jgi:hypothetical protein
MDSKNIGAGRSDEKVPVRGQIETEPLTHTHLLLLCFSWRLVSSFLARNLERWQAKIGVIINLPSNISSVPCIFQPSYFETHLENPHKSEG